MFLLAIILSYHSLSLNSYSRRIYTNSIRMKPLIFTGLIRFIIVSNYADYSILIWGT